jgi:hypothetical protein
LDIGLVEWLDIQDSAGHSCGELPSEEFRSQVIAVAQLQAQHRLTGCLDPFQGVVGSGVVVSI